MEMSDIWKQLPVAIQGTAAQHELQKGKAELVLFGQHALFSCQVFECDVSHSSNKLSLPKQTKVL